MKKKESKTNYLVWWVIALLVFISFAFFIGNNEEPKTLLEREDEVSEVKKEIDEEESE